MVAIEADLVTLGAAMLGSGGLIAVLAPRVTRKAAAAAAAAAREAQEGQLLMRLAYDAIAARCLALKKRGWITEEEYVDLDKGLYEPYRRLGGNSLGTRLVEEVKALPILPKDEAIASWPQARDPPA